MPQPSTPKFVVEVSADFAFTPTYSSPTIVVAIDDAVSSLSAPRSKAAEMYWLVVLYQEIQSDYGAQPKRAAMIQRRVRADTAVDALELFRREILGL